MKIDKKTLPIAILSFTTLSMLWIYLYSMTGISFDHAFNLVSLIELINLKTTLILLATGLVLAKAIIVLNYFRTKLSKEEILLSCLVGSITPLIALYPLFTDKSAFLIMMMFYLTGTTLLIHFPSSKERKKSRLKALKVGWDNSKKLIYLLAIGAFFTGTFLTFLTLEERQEQFKTGIIDATQLQVAQMNLTRMLEDEEGGLELNLSREWYEENIFIPEILPEYNRSLMELYGVTWEDLPPETQEQVFNETYETFKESYGDGGLMENLQSTLGESMQEEIQERVSETMGEQLFEEIPMFKAMLDFLPIIIGLAISSFVVMYGLLFVLPFCAVINSALPRPEKKKKNKK